MASGHWCAAVFPWPEKKGTTGICFLGENASLEPVTGRSKRRGQIFSEKRPLLAPSVR